MMTRFIHDADAQSGADTDRPGLAMARRQRIRSHLVGRLCHPVSFDEGHAKKILNLVNEFGRQGCAARTDEAQRGSLSRFVMSEREQKLMHRGYARIPGDAILSNRPPKRKRVELSGHNYGSARKQSCHSRANQAMDVKERHDAERNVFFGKRVGAGDICRRYSQIEMPQGNSLRPSRASAGVENEGNIICLGFGRGASRWRIDEMDIAM